MKSYTLRTGAEHTPLSSVWKELLSKALAVGDLDPEPGWLWFLHFTPRHGRLGPERGSCPSPHRLAIQGQSGSGVMEMPPPRMRKERPWSLPASCSEVLVSLQSHLTALAGISLKLLSSRGVGPPSPARRRGRPLALAPPLSRPGWAEDRLGSAPASLGYSDGCEDSGITEPEPGRCLVRSESFGHVGARYIGWTGCRPVGRLVSRREQSRSLDRACAPRACPASACKGFPGNWFQQGCKKQRS